MKNKVFKNLTKMTAYVLVRDSIIQDERNLQYTMEEIMTDFARKNNGRFHQISLRKTTTVMSPSSGLFTGYSMYEITSTADNDIHGDNKAVEEFKDYIHIILSELVKATQAFVRVEMDTVDETYFVNDSMTVGANNSPLNENYSNDYPEEEMEYDDEDDDDEDDEDVGDFLRKLFNTGRVTFTEINKNISSELPSIIDEIMDHIDSLINSNQEESSKEKEESKEERLPFNNFDPRIINGLLKDFDNPKIDCKKCNSLQECTNLSMYDILKKCDWDELDWQNIFKSSKFTKEVLLDFQDSFSIHLWKLASIYYDFDYDVYQKFFDKINHQEISKRKDLVEKLLTQAYKTSKK